MYIEEITYQNRRDFKAIFKCEHCGNSKVAWGYDDYNFHNNVIPKMKCEKCGKIANENYNPLSTKYPEGVQV